jgi:putative endonuclease
MSTQSYVYIMANVRNGTLYISVTLNLTKRIFEHKSKTIEGFTKKYSLDKLVWFEEHPNIQSVISREKQLKK